MADLAAFEQEILSRLSDPVNAFYDALPGAEGDQSGIAGLIQGLSRRITLSRLVAQARTELRRVFEMAYQVAGNYGNGGRVMSDQQHRDVLRRLSEAEGYLDGFVQDLPQMSRAQALARIAKYIPPILTTYSAVAASNLPTLPILPNDPRLECVRKAHLPVCRCRLRIVRRGPSDWDVYWDLDPAGIEHCTSCQSLNAAWNPLKIRNGRIVGEARAA